MHVPMVKGVTIETEGHRLLRARVEKIGQTAVAQELSVKQGTVSRIFRVLCRPRGDFIGRCYAAYGWNPLVWLTEAELHNATIRRTAGARKRRKVSVQNTRVRCAS